LDILEGRLPRSVRLQGQAQQPSPDPEAPPDAVMHQLLVPSKHVTPNA
jgi:hypothetical protein